MGGDVSAANLWAVRTAASGWMLPTTCSAVLPSTSGSLLSQRRDR